MILAFLTSRIGAIALGVTAGAALLGGVYLYGVQTGRQAERAAALERSVDNLRDRNLTDDKIRTMDDVALCRALGGLPDECASIGL